MQQSRKKKLFFPVILVVLLAAIGAMAVPQLTAPVTQVEQTINPQIFLKP